MTLVPGVVARSILQSRERFSKADAATRQAAKEIRVNRLPHSATPGSILLVEHDDALRDVLRTALEDEGHEVHPVANAPSCVEIATLHPDLLILDVERNKVADGWRLVEEIRAMPRGSPMPIVVTSGDGAIVAPSDVRVCSEAAAILVKPFSLDDLLPVIATALARRDLLHSVQELIAEPVMTQERDSIGF